MKDRLLNREVHTPAHYYIDQSPKLTTLLDWLTVQAKTAIAKAREKKDFVIEQLIWLKVIHIGDVVERAVQVAQREGQNVEDAIALALLHDYARFDQALFGSYSDVQTNFNHAHKGANAYRNAPTVWRLFSHRKRKSFFVATAKHSDAVLDIPNRHAQAIRDYDKLGLYSRLEFYATWKFGPSPLTGNAVSQKVMDDFVARQIILHADRKTEADKIVSMLAWIFDLNFESSRQICIEEKVDETIYKLLVSIGTPDKQIETIRDTVEEWKASIHRERA